MVYEFYINFRCIEAGSGCFGIYTIDKTSFFFLGGGNYINQSCSCVHTVLIWEWHLFVISRQLLTCYLHLKKVRGHNNQNIMTIITIKRRILMLVHLCEIIVWKNLQLWVTLNDLSDLMFGQNLHTRIFLIGRCIYLSLVECDTRLISK